MFKKSIDKMLDECVQEIMETKNPAIKKALKSVRSSMKEENFNNFLRDMVSHHISAILTADPEEDEIEEIVERDFSQVQKEMPNLHKSVVFKVELDGFEKEVYREFEMPYFAPISSLAYIILYTFNTMAYHLFDIQYKKIRYICEADPGDYPPFEPIEWASEHFLPELNLRKNSKLKMEYDYGKGYEFTIRVKEIRKHDKQFALGDARILSGKGFGLWEDAHYYMELYYDDPKRFYKEIAEDGLDKGDFPIDFDFELEAQNAALKEEFEKILIGYEMPEDFIPPEELS